MAAELTKETFRTALDTSFRVDSADLRLTRVVDGGVANGFEQFSVFFEGPGDRVLPQGIYEFRHDVLGTIRIFIVPVLGSTRERTLYEAAFNRVAK